MTKNKIKTIRLFILASMILLIGACSSGKKTAKSEFGDQILMPCSEKNHRSDANYIRASQIARSSDLTISKEKAFLMTHERLVRLVESQLRAAARRYVNEKTVSGDPDFGEIFESMIVGSVNDTSYMINIVCEESFLNDRGIYTTAMTLETAKQSILDAVMNRENREKYFRLQQDMDDFKHFFDQETQRWPLPRN